MWTRRKSSGYVAPSQQTITGLIGQELMGTVATTVSRYVIWKKYLNHLTFITRVWSRDVANAINTEFSGLGRTPGSAMNQQQIIGITDLALPMTFEQYEEKENPSAWNCTDNTNTCTNRITIRKYRKTKKLSRFFALQQYSNIVNPIATGLPVQTSSTQTQANPITTAMGGALIGSKFGGVGGWNRRWLRIFRRVTIMFNKFKKFIFDLEVNRQSSSKYIMLLFILCILGIII